MSIYWPNLFVILTLLVVAASVQHQDDIESTEIMSESFRIRTLPPPYQVFHEIKQFGPDPDDEAVFTEQPEDTLLTGSLPVLLKCAAKNAARLDIECNGQIRKATTRLNETSLIQSISILIQSDEFDSSIKCRCMASCRETNNTVLSNVATITKSYLEKEFQTEPMDEIAYLGDTVELRCDPPRGSPRPSVYWLKNGIQINTRSDSSRIKLSNDFSLLILQARTEDAGNYVCVATNQIETIESSSARLGILDLRHKYVWSDWSDWSECPQKCGRDDVTSKRYRHCQTINKLSQMEKVPISLCGSETSFQDRPCFIKECIEPKTEVKVTSDHKNADVYGISVDKATLSFSIGAMASLMLMVLLVTCVLLAFSNRKRRRRFKCGGGNKNSSSSMPRAGHMASEVNLYYTCEGSGQIGDEEDCSLFKFTRFLKKTSSGLKISNGGEFPNSCVYADGTRIYENHVFEKNRVDHKEISMGNGRHQNLVNSPYQIQKQTPDKPLNKKKSSSSTSSSSSRSSNRLLNQANPYTPTSSVNTKTSTLSSSPSSSTYYGTPKTNYRNNNYPDLCQYANFSTPDQIYETPECLDAYQQARNNHIRFNPKSFLLLNPSLTDPEHLDIQPTDICVGQITSAGGKLTLDCGISLIVPVGAVQANSVQVIYLGLCRSDMNKPKLASEKATHLSEVILIGPASLRLLQPAVLIVDHCAKNVNQDWMVKLHFGDDKTGFDKTWETVCDNNQFFMNCTDRNIILMTSQPGRYAFTGESSTLVKTAQKYLRMVVFCSESLTSNELSLRIYLIDNILVALQAVLLDEKQISGMLVEASEPFLVGYSNECRLGIEIDRMQKGWNCKYNVNRQEIPVGHIWMGNGNLLHCTFTIEKTVDVCGRFECCVRAPEVGVGVGIGFGINDLVNRNIGEVNEMKLIDLDRSRRWLKASRLVCCQNMIRDFYRMKVDFKKEVCSALDDNGRLKEYNWKLLAKSLAIDKNLSYFASKTSPTCILLLYLEAISEIRACELNGLDYESYIQEIQGLDLPMSINYEAVFQQSIHFLDLVKTNRNNYVS